MSWVEKNYCKTTLCLMSGSLVVVKLLHHFLSSRTKIRLGKRKESLWFCQVSGIKSLLLAWTGLFFYVMIYATSAYGSRWHICAGPPMGTESLDSPKIVSNLSSSYSINSFYVNDLFPLSSGCGPCSVSHDLPNLKWASQHLLSSLPSSYPSFLGIPGDWVVMVTSDIESLSPRSFQCHAYITTS